MSATYNWAYRPGVANKYGFVIPNTADDVKPSGVAYFALFGNDITGNGSRQRPWRTPNATNTLNICASGVYRYGTCYGNNNVNLIGDGDVVFDVSFTSFSNKLFNSNVSLFNLKFLGDGTSMLYSGNNDLTIKDCIFDRVSVETTSISVLENCIFDNINTSMQLFSRYNLRYNNNTFINCTNILLSGGLTQYNGFIFNRCNISYNDAAGLPYPPINNVIYSIYYQCNFSKVISNKNGLSFALYPSVSTGFTYVSNLEDFKSFTGKSSFSNVIFTDPKFNDIDNGDFTLTFDSPAKNLSYFGTYVGAKSIGQGLKVRAAEADGDFDFSTAINVTIADNSITLINPLLNGSIETNVIENTLGRELKSIPIYGFNADRNGQYIDSISDLASTTKGAGDMLNIPASYIVEGGAINYNGSVLTAGQRFTTVPGQTTFTTVVSGVVREILEAPQRHTVEMKLSDIQPFTTEVFNHFEPGIAPTTNNVGDARLGSILRGNGDPDYVRGGLGVKEFPVNKRYIKLRFTIHTNNLKP